MQIAIDTSTDFASLALVQGREVIAELTWHCGLNHTVETLPRLYFLLQQSGLKVEDADCIIVAKGPGSFNGLRVGVSAAKGLAFSLGIPIIGISTLEVAAYQHAEAGLPVCAVQNAGREELAAAVYQKKRTGWRQVLAEHLTTPEDLPSLLKEKTIICGEINETLEKRLKRLFRSGAVLASVSGRLRRAAYLAELGQKRIQAGEFDDVATLQPIYLRKPPITERKRP